jgi:hypothetical protein
MTYLTPKVFWKSSKELYSTSEYDIEVKTPKHLERRRWNDSAQNVNWHGLAVAVVYVLVYANIAFGFLNACSILTK